MADEKRSCLELFKMFFEVKILHFLPASSVRQHHCLPWKKRSKLMFFTLTFQTNKSKQLLKVTSTRSVTEKATLWSLSLLRRLKIIVTHSIGR